MKRYEKRNYRRFLSEIARLELVDQVAPVQYAIRLLIPPGSRLLERADVRGLVEELDEPKLSYVWRNRDPRVDELQHDLERLIQIGAAQAASRRTIFQRIWQRAYQASANNAQPIAAPALHAPPGFVPYLTEPWFC